MRLVFFLIGILIWLMSYAQNEPGNFNSYTTKDGLSNNAVRRIIQDSRKFLWIGTMNGLNRFDGHEFKKFFSRQNSANSLSSNFIFNILEYSTGQLLICTDNGLSVLNTLTGQFENEKINFAPLKAGSGVTILSAYKTVNGQVWVNHSGEIDILDSNLKYLYRFTDIPWARSLRGSLIYKDGYIDKKNRLWFATDTSGIQIIDFSAKQVWDYKNNPQNLAFLNKTKRYIRSFLLDETNNTLWYAPWGAGLIRHDLVTHKEQRQSFGINEYKELTTVNAIIQKSERYLLCALGTGICEVDMHSLAYMQIADKKQGLDFVHTKDNQFWAGAIQGIIHLKGASTYYKELLLPAPETPGFLRECTGLTNTKDGKIYATYRSNSLFVIEKDRHTVSSFRIPVQSKIRLTEACEDKTGQVWIGTSDGVFLFDPGSKKFSRPPFLPNELHHKSINVIFCDHSGDIWIGTRFPFILYRFNSAKKSLQRITNDIIDRFTMLYNESRISRITEDSKNNLWMTSFLGGGIIQFNGPSGQWKIYPASNRNKPMLVDKGITALYPDENSNLWMAEAFGNGLMRYNYITDSLTRFTQADGLPADLIVNAVADQSGNLWLYTEYGFTQFNMRNHRTVSYNLQNSPISRFGYTENLFDPVTNSLLYAMDDRWLFIELNHLPKDTVSIIPLVDRIVVNNKEIFINASVQKPVFNHEEKNIAIGFTGVHFSDVHGTDFAYQLSGLDTGWRFSDASRSAQYANLAPGDYIFKIKTANQNGKWGPVFDAFRYTIRPVFWETVWFRLSVFSLISFLIYWFVRRRIKTIRREAELKHKLSETEMMALRSQMNPHFIFNSLNAIDNLIQTNQTDKATTYLSRFAKLIRSLLESSKNNVVPFHKDFETLQLFLQLEQFRCNNKFVYDLQADEELLNGDYKVPPLIIQPFVENAIHHGLLNKLNGERNLLVKASLENNFIKYIVQDNGVGRIKAIEIKKLNRPEHKSYGIQISTERIHLYNQNGKTGDIFITDLVEEGRAVGTEVKVNLKIY